MAGEAEEEQKKLRVMLAENGELRSKKLFIFLSVLCIGGIFAVFMVGISQNSDVKFHSEKFKLDETLSHK